MTQKIVTLPLSAEPERADTIIHRGQGGADVTRTVLPNGLRILSEYVPNTLSVNIGFWVPVGSRDEAPGHEGSTHFLEHLLFKGTPSRSAYDIAEAFDSIGGESNAATAKESTCYYAKVLSRDVPTAVEVIADMITSASLEEADVEQERGVIIEELAMDADDPADVAHERFAQAVLGEHALGRPIGGTPEVIRALSRDAMYEHFKTNYRPQDVVVTAAGDISHDRLCELVIAALDVPDWDFDTPAAPRPRRSTVPALGSIAPAPGLTLVRKENEQANVILGGLGLTAMDERRYVLSVLNAILGGGISSRLFQQIREQRGLAYSVYSFASAYSDAGYFGVYAGCSPANTPEVIRLVRGILADFAEHGVTEEELTRARGQIAGSTIMAMEDHSSRMSRLGRSELMTGEFMDAETALARIDAVTVEQVHELARHLFAQELTVVVVGPFDSESDLAAALTDADPVGTATTAQTAPTGDLP